MAECKPDGPAVGVLLGAEVGTLEAATVGKPLDIELGMTECTSDGPVVGASLGVEVGMSETTAGGYALGISLGVSIEVEGRVVEMFEGRLVGANADGTADAVDGTKNWPGGPGLRGRVGVLDGARVAVLLAGPGLRGLDGEADGA
jgi:hypothetical protein